MEHNILSLDFWQDTVTYEGQTMPTGTLGCAALNIPDAVIDELAELCSPINGFMKTLTSGMPDPALLPSAKEAAESILKSGFTRWVNEYLLSKKSSCHCLTIPRYELFRRTILTGIPD